MAVIPPVNPKDFTDASTPSGSEIFPLYQTGWKKISLTVLKDWLATLFGSLAAEHTHANKSSLDSYSSASFETAGAVSSHESAYDHGDIAHTNRTALDNVTGTNTGDQDLSGLAALNHNHTGTYDPLGAATGAVGTHEASFNHSSMVGDAPNDGKYYLRRNGAWEELVIS